MVNKPLLGPKAMNKERLRELVRDVARGERAMDLIYKELSPKGVQASELEPELIKTLDAASLLDEVPQRKEDPTTGPKKAFRPSPGKIPSGAATRILGVWRSSQLRSETVTVYQLHQLVGSNIGRRTVASTLSILSMDGFVIRVTKGFYRLPEAKP
jgi:hypothetical protein